MWEIQIKRLVKFCTILVIQYCKSVLWLYSGSLAMQISALCRAGISIFEEWKFLSVNFVTVTTKKFNNFDTCNLKNTNYHHQKLKLIYLMQTPKRTAYDLDRAKRRSHTFFTLYSCHDTKKQWQTISVAIATSAGSPWQRDSATRGMPRNNSLTTISLTWCWLSVLWLVWNWLMENVVWQF